MILLWLAVWGYIKYSTHQMRLYVERTCQKVHNYTMYIHVTLACMLYIKECTITLGTYMLEACYIS